MLWQKAEQELADQRHEWAREFQKSYERWFQDMQALFLSNFSYGLYTQQLSARWLSSLPYYPPDGSSETPSLPPADPST